MEEKDIKKLCAREALKYINNNDVIGLGGGSTIGYLVEYIKEKEGLNLTIVTPSDRTKMLCIKNGLNVAHTCSINKVSVAFDGCDEVDEDLNALKSGGGIHTKEKLIASMAEEYILLADESKFVRKLTFRPPVVLEILPEALAYVEKETKKLGGEPEVRTSSAKDGYAVSDNGNLLLDVRFSKVEDIPTLSSLLRNICGVVETSLFTNVVSKVLLAGQDGVRVVNRKYINKEVIK